MMDRIRAAFARHADSYAVEAKAQDVIAQKLGHMLMLRVAPGGRMLEAGHGTGFLTQHLARLRPREIWLNDLAMPVPRVEWGAETNVHALAGDIGGISLPMQLDVIASASMLQWIREPERILAKFCRALKPGGVMAISSFGPRHFEELRGFGLMAGAPSYRDGAELAAGMPSEMRPLVVEDDAVSCRFTSALAFLSHLRATGVNGFCGGQLSVGRLKALMRRMDEKGDFTLTYRPSYCIARKRG